MLTLYKGGALRNLEKVLEEYKVDITTLQEIRWVGAGILERQGINIQGVPGGMCQTSGGCSLC